MYDVKSPVFWLYIFFMYICRMERKICSKCGEEKGLSEFYKQPTGKLGVRSECIECTKKYKGKYREENRDKIKTIQKKYYDKNQIILRDKKRIYRENNNDLIKERNRIDKKNRRENSSFYRLSENIRRVIRQSIDKNGYTKKSRTQEILGCSYDEFRIHIESQFEDWMTWDNRGLYNGEFKYGWDIDHIQPISMGKTEEDIIRLNHYTNLRPLCSKVNRDIKRDRVL